MNYKRQILASAGVSEFPRRDLEPRTLRDPVDRLVDHVNVLGDPAIWASPEPYESLAVAVLDSVWSLGVLYSGVLNVLARYRTARRAEGVDPTRDTPHDLVAFIDKSGGPDAFAAVVRNRQRTSASGGILKAEAVRLAAAVLVAGDMQTPTDLASAEPEQLEALREQWTSIRGQASGLSWDYLLMLTGVQGVKADRMIRRFVADALGVDEIAISAQDARMLVTAAAARLGVGISDLDYAPLCQRPARRSPSRNQ